MRDLLTETLGRLVYVTCPLWLVVYLVWRRDWEGVFVAGVVLHGFWFGRNLVTCVQGKKVWTGLVLALALVGCGQDEEKNRPNDGAPNEPLAVKAEVITSLLPSVRDPDGFVEFDKCDSVHWSALTGAAAGGVNLRAVVDDDGKVHRRPLRHGECYPENSKSENSRDLFLMVLAYALMHDDLDLIHGIFKYGRAHNWVMGKGPLSRTFFTPNMQALYAQAIEHLGGPAYLERLQPIVWVSDLTGFEAHLQVMSVLVYGKIHGYITEKGVEVLERSWERQPRNPLFAAAHYRYSGVEAARADAVRSLSDEGLWPADRLPTSAERCEPWLVQRDSEGDSWLPCPEEGRTHSGGDYLFSYAVLSGRF